MRYVTALVLLTFAVASRSLADCKTTIRARSTTNITIGNIGTDCNVAPPPAAGDTVSITAGNEVIAATVVKYVPAITVGGLSIPPTLVVASIDPEPDKLRLINNESSVSIKVGDITLATEVLSPTPNYFRHDWSIGPATSGDPDGGTADSADGANAIQTPAALNDAEGSNSNIDSGAIRLRYAAQYAKTGMLGIRFGRAQTLATVDIDTTDQSDPSFIDNNRATLGARWELPAVGNFLKQGTIGFDGKLARAAHSDVRDLDAAIAVSGWLPIVRTLNLFNREGDFIGAPLSFTASYGYRNRHLQEENFRGWVFEAIALYHVFALDRYKVDVQGTWTVNNLSNRPASTPRSQRLYKATISYLADPSKGFSVLTSFEDGSAGVMLTDVRQYFIGIALSKLNFSSSAK